MILLVSGNYVITNEFLFRNAVSDEVYIVCDTSSGVVNVTLPEVNQDYMNVEFYISDGSSNAAINNINVLANGTDLINGASGIVLDTDNGCCSIFVASSSDTGDGVTNPKSMWIAGKSTGGGGGSYGANNGLNLIGSTFKLGGTLLANTTITASTFDFIFTGAKLSKNAFTLDVQNTSTGSAVRAKANGGVGSAVQAFALGDGIVSQSTNGSPFNGYTQNGDAAVLQSINGGGVILTSYLLSVFTLLGGTGTSVESILNLRKQNGIAGSIGNGLSIDIYAGLNNLFGSVLTSRIASVYENVTNLNESAALDFSTIGSGTLSRKMSINGNGKIIFDKYGINTFAGTPAKLLGVDASGNVVETTSIAARNYGSFYDTTKQIASGVDTVDAIQLNSTDSSATNGISIVNDTFGNPTEITVTKTSIYNIQFSAQLNRVGGGVLRQTSIWLRKNGADVLNTNTHISVQTNSNKVVAAWNFVISLNAGDNVQLMWSVQDIDIELLYEPQNLSIPHPATPSVILTITEV
jgi:hypothetical protein